MGLQAGQTHGSSQPQHSWVVAGEVKHTEILDVIPVLFTTVSVDLKVKHCRK